MSVARNHNASIAAVPTGETAAAAAGALAAGETTTARELGCRGEDAGPLPETPCGDGVGAGGIMRTAAGADTADGRSDGGGGDGTAPLPRGGDVLTRSACHRAGLPPGGGEGEVATRRAAPSAKSPEPTGRRVRRWGAGNTGTGVTAAS